MNTAKTEIEGMLAAEREKVSAGRRAVASSDAKAGAFQQAATLLNGADPTGAYRRRIEERIRRERAEARRIAEETAEAEARLEAFEETLRLLSKDVSEGTELRAGSDVARARACILEAGRPLLLDELIQQLGKPASAESRGSLRGSIGRYAREGTIFVKTAPNTFGLLELGHSGDGKPEPDDLPDCP